MNEPLPSNLEEFASYLKVHPELVEKFKREQALEEFKEKYGVKKSTPLKCPACRDMYGGTLWYSVESPTRLVCKKCKLVFWLECLSMPNSKLIEQIRLINKGKGKTLIQEEQE